SRRINFYAHPRKPLLVWRRINHSNIDRISNSSILSLSIRKGKFTHISRSISSSLRLRATATNKGNFGLHGYHDFSRLLVSSKQRNYYQFSSTLLYATFTYFSISRRAMENDLSRSLN